MEHRPNSANEPSSKSSNSRAGDVSFQFITLFPETIDGATSGGLLSRARRLGRATWSCVNPRDFAPLPQRRVDDSPYGGGEGMVLRADVLLAAWHFARKQVPATRGKPRTIYLTPQGRKLDNALARRLASCSDLILVSGHYEGVDERFIQTAVDEEVSIGDYVLGGGDLPALVLAEAVSRWIPGVVGNPDSLLHDSLSSGLLKYPVYTRPVQVGLNAVPEVLLSGDHGEIKKWRSNQSLERTEAKRPDLWEEYLDGKHSEGERQPGLLRKKAGIQNVVKNRQRS